MLRIVFTKCLNTWPSIVSKKNHTFDYAFNFLLRNYSSDASVPILQDRFIDFFRNDMRYKVFTDFDSESKTSLCPVDVLNENAKMKGVIDNITIQNIPTFLYCLSLHRDSLTSQDLRRVLLAVDDAYCEQLTRMDKENVLKCLYLWHNLGQGNTVRTKIYKQFMQRVTSWLKMRNNCLEHLVYVIFYIGMCKKMKEAQNLIRMCLIEIEDHVNTLSLDELCIISSASYKCSVKIKSENLLHSICYHIKMNCDSLVSDPAYLVTFFKVLRFSKFYNYNVMDVIADNMHCNKIKKMNFTAKVHVLAMYAEALYDKKNFINSLIQSCIDDTQPSKNSTNSIRMKDISRFLWAISFLGYDLSYLELEHIIEEMERNVSQNRHLKDPEHIIGSLLSLWCMGLQESGLFTEAVNECLMKILQEKSFFRARARLSLLLTSIEIERPELLRGEHYKWKTKNIIPPEILEKHLNRRIFLKHLFTAVNNLGHHLKLHVVCGCHIPNLNILGVTVTSFTGKILHIEVLDALVCLHQTHTPHGLMKLKLRLLKNLGHQVLTVPDNEFNIERNPSRLYLFLEENLAKLECRI